MKKIIFSLLFTLVTAFVLAPFAVSDEAHATSLEHIPDSFTKDLGIEIITEENDTLIYRMTEEGGFLYEYHEITEKLNDGTDRISIIKYQINNNEKIKVDTNVIDYYETNEEIIIQGDGYNEPLKFNIKEVVKVDPPEYSTSPVMPSITPRKDSSITIQSMKTGGSKIAALWWEEYSSGTAYAINYPRSKKTKTTQWQYRDFRAAANEIRSAEWALISGGWLGVADAVYVAIKKGEMLSLTLVKKIISKLGKTIPVAGTLWAIYDYVSKCIKAGKAWNKIP